MDPMLGLSLFLGFVSGIIILPLSESPKTASQDWGISYTVLVFASIITGATFVAQWALAFTGPEGCMALGCGFCLTAFAWGVGVVAWLVVIASIEKMRPGYAN